MFRHSNVKKKEKDMLRSQLKTEITRKNFIFQKTKNIFLIFRNISRLDEQI
jgi:hypothetical protein